MPAIPQEHNGIHYRSRTEARWGEFWTLAGLDFEYEPEGFDLWGEWYVPDFLVNGVYFEIKPRTDRSDRETRLAAALAADQKSLVVIAAGNPGRASLRAYHPKGEETRAAIVEEFRSEQGAWLAHLADGGSWAVPLAAGLGNCAATGQEHALLDVAGRLQFNRPVFAEKDPRSFERLARPTARVLTAVRALRWKGDA